MNIDFSKINVNDLFNGDLGYKSIVSLLGAQSVDDLLQQLKSENL